MSGVHVRVRLGGELYALPVTHVLEIGEIGELTPVFGASAASLGIRNLRGDVLPVFDLATVLGLRRSGSATRMVVVETTACRTGLAVDEVTHVDELPDGDQEADSPLLARAVLIESGLVGVIDMDRLFESLGASSQ